MTTALTAAELVAEARRLDREATKGPWSIWDGPSYVGGGKDLCIGAGDKWLANMDNRRCESYACHIGACRDRECSPESKTDICTLASDCVLEDEITAEQAANAKLIAFARTALPRLVALVEAAVEMREAERDTGSPLVPYPYGPCAVHDYGCPATVTGKRSSACNCGGAVIDARIVASRAAFDALAGGEEKK